MNTSDIVKNIAFGNYEIAKNVINHVLLSKTSIALDEKKKEVAKKMYCEECNINEETDDDYDKKMNKRLEKEEREKAEEDKNEDDGEDDGRGVKREDNKALKRAVSSRRR